MAQWQTLTTLCRQNAQMQERVNEMYRRINFPYKFRSHFATWIEAQEWSDIDINSEIGRKRSENLFKELMMKVDAVQESLRTSQSYDLETTLNFLDACHIIKQRFEGNYPAFVSVINSCLREEQTLIESCCDNEGTELRRKNRQTAEFSQQHGIAEEISRSLAALNQEISLAESKLADVAAKQREFILNHNSISEKIANLDQQLRQQQTPSSKKELEGMKVKMEAEKNQLIMENFKLRNVVSVQHIDLACKLAGELKRVWTEVDRWHDEQKKAITALTSPVEGTLDLLDKLFDESGRSLYQMIQQVGRAIDVCKEIQYTEDEKLEKLKIVLNELKSDYLVQHLHSSLVIDRHVDRVLKVSGGKSLGFSMSVRILGGSGLGLEYNPPTVRVSLFHERDIPEGSDYIDGMCQIYNGTERKFTVNRGTKACSVQFNSIQLRNVRRPDRGKNEELVTEHKYAFVFFTTVSVCGESIPLKVISLPVILTSQTSQEIMAKGTLVWDAAFSDQERKPFAYRDTVTWGDVAAVLSALFNQNTGRPLDVEQLRYLARMAFRVKKDEDFESKQITEKQVIREKLSGREFSFWKWFWANMNLVKNYVKTEWKEGLIYGFISKDDAKRKLYDSPCGTFLLRFSESNIENSQKSDISGFLTLAVMEMDPKSGQKKLFHVKEYLSPKDLQERGLSPILDAMEVADYTHPGAKKRLLRYVWPDCNTSFEKRFMQHIQQREQIDDGYRRGKYSIEIFLTDDQHRRHRDDGNESDMASCPATPYAPSPQSVSVQSPASAMSYDLDGMVDYNVMGITDELQQMLPLQAPQRQMAAVRPQVQGALSSVDLDYMTNQTYPANYNTGVLDTSQFGLIVTEHDMAIMDQLLGSVPELQLGLDADNDLIVQNR